MDKTFQEEERNLAEIESKIDSIASRYEVNAAKLQEEIKDFYCVDYEDRERLKYLRDRHRVACESGQQYRNYQPEPYFGRLDLDYEHENIPDTLTFYIGKEGISDTTNILVIDWRSPIGACFYAVNQRNFHVGERDYTLALRRRLNIQNAKLVNFKTEYDGESVSLQGELIDPFLLTVLKDKRRHNRLTDIIRTIQDNQNEIIRRPQKESFVVQGCAGSGKTMILLHRLSYLKFNNRNMSLTGVKILTPNKFFDAHINDLSVELGLTGIERLSVEEYYVSLIRKFSSKITAVAEVNSEKALNPDLLQKLYSVEFQSEENRRYHEYWEIILDSLDESRLNQLLKSYGKKYPDTSVHNNSTYISLFQSLSSIEQTIEDYKNQQKSIHQRIVHTCKEHDAVVGELELARKTLETIMQQTALRIAAELDNVNEEVQKAAGHRSEVKRLFSYVESQLNSIERNLNLNTSQLHSIRENRSIYEDYDTFNKLSDPVAQSISEAAAAILTDITQNTNALQNVAVYNFGKRNTLKKKLAESKAMFSAKVRHFLDSREKYIETQLQNLQAQFVKTQEKVQDLHQEIDESTEKLRLVKRLQSAYNECNSLFSEKKYPDTKIDLTEATHTLCAEILSSYEKQIAAGRTISRRLSQIDDLLATLEADQKKFSANAISKEDKEYLDACLHSVKKLQLSDIFRSVLYHDVMSLYREYGQSYHKNNYRHKLYLKLLFCSFYYPHISVPDTFLNIDEAQDISIAEYRLLRSILGERCIFNLYGDINQSVYSYKGITDWEEIHEITGNNIYVLNQNYRNTLQITNFCNEEFEADVYAIGIAGDPVREMHLKEALQWLLVFKAENPDARVAVIYRHGVKAIQDELRNNLEGQQCISWQAVDDSKISVISVETAKGLEFETVVTVADQMSSNEKYISYTRALDRLIVVRDVFASEIIDDVIDANNDDPDFLDVDTDRISDENEKIRLERQLLQLLAARIQVMKKMVYPLSEQDASVDELHELTLKHMLLMILENIQKKKEIEAQEDSSRQELSESFTDSQYKAVDAGSETEMKESDIFNADEFNTYLEKVLEEPILLNDQQSNIVKELLDKKNVAYDAPSGSMKSIMLYLLALNAHQKWGKQTILTGEAHLQENELVLAEKIGLLGGIIDSSSMDSFVRDFKKEKYDIIFVPYSFFESEKNCREFLSYFKGKLAYWGLDHPLLKAEQWPLLKNLGEKLKATMYLMSKEGYGGLNLEGYSLYACEAPKSSENAQKLTFIDSKSKLSWLIDHVSLFYGQGIIYCDEESTCKQISKSLRKKKIKAEAYIDVYSDSNKERINYLTNSFSCGGLPVLVTTHDVGKNLSNPNIRFILHFDVPDDRTVYELHAMQLGALTEDHVMIDLQSL